MPPICTTHFPPAVCLQSRIGVCRLVRGRWSLSGLVVLVVCRVGLVGGRRAYITGESDARGADVGHWPERRIESLVTHSRVRPRRSISISLLNCVPLMLNNVEADRLTDPPIGSRSLARFISRTTTRPVARSTRSARSIARTMPTSPLAVGSFTPSSARTSKSMNPSLGRR